MRARGLNKRIEVYQTAGVSDGYGGSTVTPTLMTTTWAKLETLDSAQVTALGLDYTKNSLLVTTRKREDFDFNSKTIYIKYNSVKYTITSFPTDENFRHAFITFIAQREKQQTYPVYGEL